jgi:hypothetical protein
VASKWAAGGKNTTVCSFKDQLHVCFPNQVFYFPFRTFLLCNIFLGDAMRILPKFHAALPKPTTSLVERRDSILLVSATMFFAVSTLKQLTLDAYPSRLSPGTASGMMIFMPPNDDTNSISAS